MPLLESLQEIGQAGEHEVAQSGKRALLSCQLHCSRVCGSLLTQKSTTECPVCAAQNTKGEVVKELGELLVEAGMQNVLPLPKARVPVVKFVVGENGTKVSYLRDHGCLTHKRIH